MAPNPIHPPGKLLSNWMIDNKVSAEEVAKRTGLPLQWIGWLIMGKLSITTPVAKQLEALTKRPASEWLNLQAKYADYQAELNGLRAEAGGAE